MGCGASAASPTDVWVPPPTITLGRKERSTLSPWSSLCLKRDGTSSENISAKNWDMWKKEVRELRAKVLRGKLPEGDSGAFSNQVLLTILRTEDTSSELDALNADVFPYLRELCRNRGLAFSTLDMKWGLYPKAPDTLKVAICNHVELEAYIEEGIERMGSSSGPATLAILGDYDGSSTVPLALSLEEWSVLSKHLPSSEMEILRKWYQLDTNNLEPHSYLRPVTEVTTGQADWEDDSREIARILTSCSQRLFPGSEKTKTKFQSSVLHRQCSGLFKALTQVKRQRRCFLFRRTYKEELYSESVGKGQIEERQFLLKQHSARGSWRNLLKTNNSHLNVTMSSVADDGRQQHGTNNRIQLNRLKFQELPGLLANSGVNIKDFRVPLWTPEIESHVLNLSTMKESERRKVELPASLFAACKQRSVDVAPQSCALHSQYLVEFCDAVTSTLSASINDSIAVADFTQDNNLLRGSNLMLEERDVMVEIGYHMGFASALSKTSTFNALSSMADRIRKSLDFETSQPQFPKVIHGQVGAGKRSLLAHVAVKTIESIRFQEYPVSVVLRFLGQSQHTRDLSSLLISLITQLRMIFGVPARASSTDGPKALRREFRRLLAKATPTDQLLIILNGLHSLSDTDCETQLSWLPLPPPPNVTIIVSTDNALSASFSALSSQIPVASNFFELPRNIRKETGAHIVNDLLKARNRTLSEAQIGALLQSIVDEEVALPWLALGAHEMASWRGALQGDILKGQAISLTGNEAELIDALLEKLENTWGSRFVRFSLGLITASRYGLSESELDDVLSCIDNVLDTLFNPDVEANGQYWTTTTRVPSASFFRLRRDLDFCLSGNLYHDAVGTVWSWSHASFRAAAADRYLLSWKQLQELVAEHCKKQGEGSVKNVWTDKPPKLLFHKILFDYFSNRWVDGKPRKNPLSGRFVFQQRHSRVHRVEDRRRLDELCFHSIFSGELEEAYKLLTSTTYVCAKVKWTASFNDLLQEYFWLSERLYEAIHNPDAQAVPAAVDREEILAKFRQQRKGNKLWRRFVVANSRALSRQPPHHTVCCLAQQLPDTHPVRQAFMRMGKDHPQVKEVAGGNTLKVWVGGSERRTANAVVFQSSEGIKSTCESFSAPPDGSMFAIVSTEIGGNSSLSVWTDSGRLIGIKCGQFRSAAMSPDHQRIVVLKPGSVVQVLRVDPLLSAVCWFEHEGASKFIFHPNCVHVLVVPAASTDDSEPVIYDMRNGDVGGYLVGDDLLGDHLEQMEVHQLTATNTGAFHPSGKCLVTPTTEGFVTVWNCKELDLLDLTQEQQEILDFYPIAVVGRERNNPRVWVSFDVEGTQLLVQTDTESMMYEFPAILIGGPNENDEEERDFYNFMTNPSQVSLPIGCSMLVTPSVHQNGLVLIYRTGRELILWNGKTGKIAHSFFAQQRLLHAVIPPLSSTVYVVEQGGLNGSSQPTVKAWDLSATTAIESQTTERVVSSYYVPSQNLEVLERWKIKGTSNSANDCAVGEIRELRVDVTLQARLRSQNGAKVLPMSEFLNQASFSHTRLIHNDPLASKLAISCHSNLKVWELPRSPETDAMSELLSLSSHCNFRQCGWVKHAENVLYIGTDDAIALYDLGKLPSNQDSQRSPLFHLPIPAMFYQANDTVHNLGVPPDYLMYSLSTLAVISRKESHFLVFMIVDVTLRAEFRNEFAFPGVSQGIFYDTKGNDPLHCSEFRPAGVPDVFSSLSAFNAAGTMLAVADGPYVRVYDVREELKDVDSQQVWGSRVDEKPLTLLTSGPVEHHRPPVPEEANSERDIRPVAKYIKFHDAGGKISELLCGNTDGLICKWSVLHPEASTSKGLSSEVPALARKLSVATAYSKSSIARTEYIDDLVDEMIDVEHQDHLVEEFEVQLPGNSTGKGFLEAISTEEDGQRESATQAVTISVSMRLRYACELLPGSTIQKFTEGSHVGPVSVLTFIEIGEETILVSGGEDGLVKFWCLNDARVLETLVVSDSGIVDLQVDSKQQVLSVHTEEHVAVPIRLDSYNTL